MPTPTGSRLAGPRLAARSGTPRQLVVFLHGYGADGNDLIDLGREWQGLLPDAEFLSPHAPEPCGMAPAGRQWFSLSLSDPDERWRGAQGAGPGLDAFLDEELARLSLPASRLALVGFSQGCMMALHVGLRRSPPPAAILGYSGMLVGPQHLQPVPGPRPPVLLVHGDRDNVIPVDALFDSAEALARAEVPCQWHLSAGMAHGIDPVGLRIGGQFLAQSFGLRLGGAGTGRPA